MERDPGFAAFLPLLLMTVPIIILNIFLAMRKGKNPILYGLLSIIPLVGFYLLFYLISFLDKSVSQKIDKILDLLEAKDRTITQA